MAGYGLSKSRIIAWKQCPKRLWLQIHRRDLLDVSDETERGFQIGYEVGDVAQGLFPTGILIEDDDDLSAALVATKTAMTIYPDSPLFEATFQHDGVLVRADLLLPTPKGYRMVEVKSSASVKPYHIDDCAVQAWVLQQNDIALYSIELAHIDTSFVYQGNGDYQGLFHHENLDELVYPLVELVPDWILEARSTLSGDEPAIEPGAQCTDPFECPFIAYCTRDMAAPEQPEFPLDILYRMQETTKEQLRSKGFENALQVPTEFLNETQQWIQRVSQTGVAELALNVLPILINLPYPRYYLDFETINLAVPRWAQTSPYRSQVPFQWSCHIESIRGQLQHLMFLDVSGNDPRRACAEQMIAALGNEGPVFVYYQAFEKGRIAELAALFPDLAPALLAINDRVVDLLPIARTNYYHPDMKGSWSIKAVLPTIAPDLDYTQLAVDNGGAAQDAYREILHPDTPDVRKQELTEGLREYCKLDTLAMVRLAWFLQGFHVRLFMPGVAMDDWAAAILTATAYHNDSLLLNAVDILHRRCKFQQTAMISQPVSMLQRCLKLGYNKTLSLVDEMVTLGILSPQANRPIIVTID
ncbi:MAG: DUF2779 domain-containing protein [Methylobacter sp.]|nr:DUF2779 domain-containing protein [Candidatus Methylobacter titanis]